MFFNPKSSAQIKPATSLINPHNPSLFKQVSMEKYVKDFFSRKLDGKWYIEHLKIKNEEEYSTCIWLCLIMVCYGLVVAWIQ